MRGQPLMNENEAITFNQKIHNPEHKHPLLNVWEELLSIRTKMKSAAESKKNKFRARQQLFLLNALKDL